MKKWLIIFPIILLLGSILYFFPLDKTNKTNIDVQPHNNQPEESSLPTQSPAPSEEQEEQDEQELQIQQQLDELTLEQKIGQLLIVGIDDNSSSISKQTQQLVHDQGIGNIILFKRNIKNDKQLASLIEALKELPADHAPPLWITIDQEGGKVNRLPEQFPSAEELVELDDTAVTEQTGEHMGEALADLSIDVNFAPVLDINNNPDNPVIGSRAFGSTAQEVVTHSIAMLDGLDDYVLTVGKHFPGHGDTNVDSHASLPTINKSWEELEQLELIPFRAAIKRHIDAIMVGHLYLPQVDEQFPASLSPTIIKHYLRDELGFEGLVITDDLVMGGITENYEVGEAAVLALQAGNTMLIVGHHPKQQQEVIQSLVEAVKQHKLDERLIDEQVKLVLRMKLNKLNYLHSSDWPEEQQ
ncbi:glycoside hydrolase family 3 [Paenibacillus montaniterrae]|uniref:beta-N-acetylhexosaminidase n=1 Tax=Paenibacillus montaniterrae TaxID=429341 RepID=A0A919YR69_9BACL|nr:beta-N-acetylhexosaminidase [Paenibacillus montaniterrae]GIP15453.1 glycoside hydrolase family 3 [Paenibacillus montaniterrae]